MNEYTGADQSLLREMQDSGLLAKIYEDVLQMLVERAIEGEIPMEEGKAQKAVHDIAEQRIQGLINSLV